MTNKPNQETYIKYLEDRIEKLSQNSTLGNQDLSNLIDIENEITANDAFALKWMLNERASLTQQVERLQKKNEMSDAYIHYLMNSYWWKATYPFRLMSRHFKKNQTHKPFDFSHISVIKDEVTTIIYANSANDSLTTQINNIKAQKGFTNIKIVIMDLINSSEIAKIADSNSAKYINPLVVNNNASLISKLLGDAKYTVYIGQNIFINDDHWLYKMVRPLIDNYAILSALYDGPPPKIKNVKKETFFDELKVRIFKIGLYECMLLPANRDKVQYVPPFIINEASVIAKKGS